jgi:hypothetical protein
LGSVSEDWRFMICIGTWKSSTGKVAHAVEYALRNGYTHIDTATPHEAEVNAGIQASGKYSHFGYFQANRVSAICLKSVTDCPGYAHHLGTQYR